MSAPRHETRAIHAHGAVFSACVYEPDRSGETPRYSWLVWGPREWQREGESASKLGAWERIEAAARYGAETIRRRE